METTKIPNPHVIALICVILFFCHIFLIIGRCMGLRQSRKTEAREWGKIETIVKTSSSGLCGV